MLDAKTKQDFIKLRAAGASYRTIAKELHISKDSCQRLNDELSAQITEEQKAELAELADSFGMVRTARIKALGKMLGKIDAAIDEADFSKVSADKLLDLRLKYMTALQNDCMIPREPMGGTTADDVMKAYTDLMNQVRQGNVTTDQAAKENTILSSMLKAVDAVRIQSRINEIDLMLSGQ